MNGAIVHLFGLFTVLFGVLLVSTSGWSVFQADSLEDESANRGPRLDQQPIPPGLIHARDGTVVAAN